jgi:hypothetical protein
MMIVDLMTNILDVARMSLCFRAANHSETWSLVTAMTRSDVPIGTAFGVGGISYTDGVNL